MSGECDNCSEHCLECNCYLSCTPPETKISVTNKRPELYSIPNYDYKCPIIIERKWISKEEAKETFPDSIKTMMIEID